MTSVSEKTALELAADLAFVTRSLFFPLMLMLMLNFFFQYLVLLFHSNDTIANLNDVSESSLAFILLMQTALVGTKHAPKGRTALKTSSTGRQSNVAKPMQFFADLLILFDCGVVILGLVCVFKPHVAVEFGGAIVTNNVAENATLAFTFVYRFGELAREKGWYRLMRDDKQEIACHVVFMLYEYPSMLLESLTHVSWEYLQAIFMRLALAPCVWMTIGEHHAQRVSVFFNLPKLEAPMSVELRDFVRPASLIEAAEGVTAGVEARAGGRVGSSARLTSSRTLPKSSAVMDVASPDERDEDGGAVVKPITEPDEIELVGPAETSTASATMNTPVVRD